MIKEYFRNFAKSFSDAVGSVWAFGIAVVVIIVWAATGPFFHFSDTWQLVINTSTTIVTFIMVFIIQNTQNRDSRALHLKMDEIIRSVKEARNSFVTWKNFRMRLVKLQEQFRRLEKVAGTEAEKMMPRKMIIPSPLRRRRLPEFPAYSAGPPL